MSKTLTEMAAEIVTAQASHTGMSAEEMNEVLKKTFLALRTIKEMEEGVGAAEGAAVAPEVAGVTGMDPKKSIRRNKVICLECGKEFKMLTNRHLMKEHGMDAKQYRKKYGFTARQALSARSLTLQRRENAKERNLGQILKDARKGRPAAQTDAPAENKKKVVVRRKRKAAPTPDIAR